MVILGGFGRRENKANLFRIEYCVMRTAKRYLKKRNISLKCHVFLEEAVGCFRFECIFLMLWLLSK